MLVFFFFSSRRRHTRCGRDWSSDVCSSDLECVPQRRSGQAERRPMDRDTLSAGAARQLRDALCAIYPLEGSAAMRINAIDRSQCPVSEVRDTLRHSLTRTSETKG